MNYRYEIVETTFSGRHVMGFNGSGMSYKTGNPEDQRDSVS